MAMNNRPYCLLRGCFLTKKVSVPFLWKTREFLVCSSFSFHSYDGPALCRSTPITSGTRVAKLDTTEFIVTFNDPDLQYHIRTASSADRDIWFEGISEVIKFLTILADLQAHDLDEAATPRQLNLFLLSCKSDVLLSIAQHKHVFLALVQRLSSSYSSAADDCAACMGHLAARVCRGRSALSEAKGPPKSLARMSSQLSKAIVCDSTGNFPILRPLISVLSSEGGNVRMGLSKLLHGVLSCNSDTALVQQLVESHDILSAVLQLLESPDNSPCFSVLLSLITHIAHVGKGHAGGSTLNPYVAELNRLNAAKVLQCEHLARASDLKDSISSIMQSLNVLLLQNLQSQAIPAFDDTTSFLKTLAESLEAVAEAHARPAHPVLRPVPDDVIRNSMRGDATHIPPSWFEGGSKQRVVRVFLSSTFTDTVHERAVLLRCVHPVVQWYARKLNFEVVLSEMRFGIRQSLCDDNRTSEVCMTELKRCAEESASMSYMLFVRNKYGSRPPPRKVPQVDMEAMMSYMSVTDKRLVQDFYELDDNELISPQACYQISDNMHGAANAPAAAYVLRNKSLISNFDSRCSQLQIALRNAACLHWPKSLSELDNCYSQHPIKFFFFSVTEEEVCRGLFWKRAAVGDHTAHVFIRPIQAAGGLDLSYMDPNSHELCNFVDISDDAIDVFKQVRLSKLRQMIAQATVSSPSIVTTSNSVVEWLDGTGFHPRHAPHAIDLQKFAYVATVKLLESLDIANERLAFQPHPDMAEVLHHIKFARVRGCKFACSSETQHVTSKLREYLASDVGPGHAFVIHGASGSGKTYLMAEAADKKTRDLSSPDDAVIIRFLGTSPASSNLTDLLGSLCRQLHAISSDALPSGDDVEKLKEYFDSAMKKWQKGRLTVFLDSLDQIDDTCGGRKLGWLPTLGLSPNVRLVVSTLPDEAAPADGKPFACLSILQKRYSRSLSDSAMAEVQPVVDVRSLLLHLLKLRHHKLSDAQLRVLEAAIKVSPATQTPLVVTILAVRFCEWSSHRDLPPDNKNPDGSLFVDTSSVRSLIIQEFKALEAKHGPELVRAALSFITLAKDGVSETELSEILSLDDDVLASVYEWWVPPVRTLPTNPLTMLLADLKPYLTMRGAASGSGGLMMRWYHRQFGEAADVYFLHDVDERRRRHAQLGEFFSGAWADRSKPYNDRLKAAVQEKVAGEVSGDRQVRPQPLCLREGKNVFLAKGDAGAVNERRCREAAHHWLAADMLCEAADELCSFEGICARARCGEGVVLQQQLISLGVRIREGARLHDLQAAQAQDQLCRVEHYARWLQQDMSIIVAHPETETLASCSRQPEVSIAREDLKTYLNLTSARLTLNYGSHFRSHFRSFVLGPVNQNFDSCIFELKHHKQIIWCVAFNFDSSLLASASSDSTVAIFNTNTAMIEFVLKGHTASVRSVAWSPDGQWLVSGSDDKSIRVWDVSTQQQVAELQGHTQQVTSVAFDVSGKYLASGSFDCSVRLWDVITQQQVAELKGHTEPVWSVAIDGSGKYLASGSGRPKSEEMSSDNSVCLWDVSTQQQIAELKGHTGVVWSVAFDVSGKYLASGSYDRTVRLWDVSTQQQVAELKGHTREVTSVAFDVSGKYLASGSYDMTVCLWDVSSLQQIAGYRGHTSYVRTIAFDGSGKYLASGSFDRTVRLWNVSTQQQVAGLRGHTEQVTSIAFDRCGKYLASGSIDCTVRLWDINEKKLCAELRGHLGGVRSVAFDVSGKYLASGSSDCSVRLWDVITQQQVAELKGHTEPVWSVAIDVSGKYLASGSYDRTVRLWDISTQQQVAELRGHSGGVTSVAFDVSGKYLASGSYDMTVCLWDVITQQQVAELKGHTESVWSVAFDVSGKYLASGSYDRTVRLWDVSTQQQVAELIGHTGHVRSVAFDVSGKYLASGSGSPKLDGTSSDNSVRLWDVSTQKQVAKLKGHTEWVNSVAFDVSGKYLASCSDDHSLRLWDAHTLDGVD